MARRTLGGSGASTPLMLRHRASFSSKSSTKSSSLNTTEQSEALQSRPRDGDTLPPHNGAVVRDESLFGWSVYHDPQGRGGIVHTDARLVDGLRIGRERYLRIAAQDDGVYAGRRIV